MRTVYLEPVTFECHTTQNEEGTRIPFEDEFFDGKCDAFIEGCRAVPLNMSWTRSDGAVFHGPMITLWKSDKEMAAAQRAYEQAQLAEYEALIDELYSEVTS